MINNKITGLSENKAKQLLETYGFNEIDIKEKNVVLKILISQFTSLLVIILIISGFIFLIIGNTLDAIVIFIIVIINAAIGFLQEYKAGKAVNTLKKMLTIKCVVIRDGIEKEINTKYLVPGDIVILREGDRIPADMKLLDSFSLKVDESVLTGESVSSLKIIEENKDTLVYSGTTVVSGKATAKVITTGKSTEFGKIINLASKPSSEKTLFEKQLDKLSRVLVYILSVSVIIIFILGIIRGQSIIDMFIISVSLAIAAIPEGLPIVITLTLAMGVSIMSKKNSIVRKMSSIESLGATTIICSDKTGTLTLNEMMVTNIATSTFKKTIEGSGYLVDKQYSDKNKELSKLLDVIYNCNDSFYSKDNYFGDPTEISLKVLCNKYNHTNKYELLNEMPFSSDRKKMSTAHLVNNNLEQFTKGAFSELIKDCDRIYIDGRIRAITKKDIVKFEKIEMDFAENALRVLGVAYKPLKNKNKLSEKNLIFIGLVGMIDPPRKDVKNALKISRKAGIITKIITGDSALTAKAIAKKIGFKKPVVVDGNIIDDLDNEKALELIRKTDIFARARPEHKFRIVNLLRASGEVVAVTGDGVNDVPAIKTADIGIAMGIKGTEATKQVADVVLKDDNFSSIIEAIKQGRRIYDNIILFVKFMLAVNFDVLIFFSLLIILDFPIPLLALQILWINLVTDSLPAIALGRRKASKDIMDKPPRKVNVPIFKDFSLFIIITLIIKIFGILLLFFYGLQIDASLGINTYNLALPSHARTILLTGIVIFELFFAFIMNCNSKFNKYNLLSNKPLIYSILFVIALQLFAVYNKYMQNIFGFVNLSLTNWVYIVLFAISSLLIIPLYNFVKSKFYKK